MISQREVAPLAAGQPKQKTLIAQLLAGSLRAACNHRGMH